MSFTKQMSSTINKSSRLFSSSATKPRHLVSMLEVSNEELAALINRASYHKKIIKSDQRPPLELANALAGKTVSLIFNKRSTRTRISTEGAAAYFAGTPMFLGKDDIQLGVNESMYDTTKIISSMSSSIFARVGPHSDIQELCKHSSVPIINALCERFHPLQAIADILTIKETFGKTEGLKLAWIGDANNVINDLAIASLRSGISVSIATPKGYDFDLQIAAKGVETGKGTNATLTLTRDPLEAVKGADILVTDTWISMGQEAETARKLKEFAGYQITNEMAIKGGASPNWKFMHCLPRHPEEVDDEVFYGERSLVFPEGENRLYSAISVIEGFVINKGDLLKYN